MIPWLKKMVKRADLVGSSHSSIMELANQLEENSKELAKALRQGRCAAYAMNKKEIGEKCKKLLEDVVVVSLAFNLDFIKDEKGETPNDTR